MNASTKIKVNERLIPFAVSGQEDVEHSSLAELDVFHEQFRGVDALPAAREVLEKMTYEQGVEQGRAQGLQEAKAKHQAITDLVSGITTQIESLGNQIQNSHSRAISNVLRAVLPELSARAVGEEVRQFLSDVSGQTLHGEVTLSVNPCFEVEINEIIQELVVTEGNSPSFVVRTDETMIGAAVTATWKSGGGDIDIDGAVKHCLSLLAPAEDAS